MDSRIFPEDEKHSRYLYHLMFVVTIVVAVFIRWKYIFIERMWPDEALYCWYAQRIYNMPTLIFSKEITSFHPPLFSSLLSIGHFFFSPEMACRIVSLILNLIGIIGIYILGIRVGGYFLGTFSCITLAFNFLYLSQSAHILIDGPMAVFCILFIISMTKLNVNNPLKYDICVGLIGCSIILLKWSGILVVPFLIIFYLVAFPEIPIFKRLKKATIPLFIIGMAILLLLLNNVIQLGQILPNVSALGGKHLVKPFWYYVIKFHNIIMIPYLIPFFLYGLFVAFTNKKREGKLLAVWFFVFLVGISVAQEKGLRYSLLILPSSLLITSMGLEDALKRILKIPSRVFIVKLICVLCVFLFYWQMYPRTQRFLDKGGAQFTGFKEAGDWIKKEATVDMQVLAGSPRIIRYYTGINFQEFGGTVIALPGRKKDFEGFIKSTEVPVILEIDYWERTQPNWIFPLSEMRIKYLNDYGFKLQKIVSRPVNNEAKDVVWVFSRK